MKCHQRVIREEAALRAPRSFMPIDECWVRQITADEARPIILEYEWLGTMNKPIVCYGLDSPDGLVGVACFGVGNGSRAHLICGEEHRHLSICLERGACVHWAHEHAGSKLVAGACRLLAQETRYRIVYAYSDVQAGEIGTIYQACNWLYLGQSPGRTTNYRWKAQHKPTGKWWSTRQIRTAGMRVAELKKDPDWHWVKDIDKHKYVQFVGDKRERKRLRSALRFPVLPYPKR